MRTPGCEGVARAHRPTPELPQHLAQLYDHFPFHRSLLDDPISPIRELATDPRNAEIAGIFGATLAIGNTTAIRGAIHRLVAGSGGDLSVAVEAAGRSGRVRGWRTFRHRWIRGDQMEYLARQLSRIYASTDSLETIFLEGMMEASFAGGLDRLSRALRGEEDHGHRSPRGYRALFPSPLEHRATAAKRLTLYVRWMVRDRFPDLGVWKRVPMGELRIPLDQHVYWIAYHLGMTARRTRSWAAVEEVTEALRRIDPIDPVKYDFVLCHTGISGDCPKRRDIAVCGPCVVRPDCLLWRRVRGAS